MSQNREVSQEWTAQVGEELGIPEEYAQKIRDLRYKIMVFIGRKPFEFQCTNFSWGLPPHVYTFTDVVMDTSKRDQHGNTTLQRITYHPYIQLVNAAFMVIPLTSEQPSN